MEDILCIIHNKKRIERRQSFMEQAADFGIKYKVFDAVENNEFPYKGISEAHRLVVKYAKDNRLKSCWIAEDDILFTCKESLRYFLANEPEIYSLYFGGVSGGDLNEETKIVTNFSGLFFYKVHESFYDAFLSADPDKQLDRWLGFHGIEKIEKILGRKPVYKVCYPMPVICFDGFSDNSKKIMVHEKYFKAYKQLI